MNELYGVYENFSDIDFDKLPNKFVIKCTHGCAYNIICRDKTNFDINEAESKVSKWMNEKYGLATLALATGAETRKMRFGHRGGNHPVKDLAAGRAFITSQNHGYVVTAESVDPAVAEVSHVNVNEGSVEGLRYKRPNCFTVQFHPEASPGPMDTEYLFDRFVDSMKGGNR